MPSADRGKLFLADLLRGQFEEAEGAQNNDDSEDDIVDDDAGAFSSRSIASASVTDTYDRLNDCVLPSQRLSRQ